MKVAALALVLFAVAAASASACGIERWAVKTLTDPAARQVDFKPVVSEVYKLVNMPVPVGDDRARFPEERRTYRVRVSLLAFKYEADGDVHLVIGDPANPGTTMIAELPNVTCTRGAQHRWAMEVARRKLGAAVGLPSSSRYRALTGTATVTGVLFFDRAHGQRGVARNGVELHPLTGFRLVP